MRAIIDGDILRYEVGFGAETGWKAIIGDGLDVMKEAAIAANPIPPFEYVRQMLLERIAYIKQMTECDSHTIYLTEGKTFRFDIATLKPYKGTRTNKKPWHYDNLSVYIRDVIGCTTVTGIEADDAMTIDHLNSEDTVLCSRDKDLRQVPGMFYSWELGNQPAFGPVEVDELGGIALTENRKDIKGTGFAFFAAQLLIGDKVDNIPGLPKCGPVAAYEALKDCDTSDGYLDAVIELYTIHYGEEEWEARLNEQARLCWLLRYINEDGSIPLWTLGDYNR